MTTQVWYKSQREGFMKKKHNKTVFPAAANQHKRYHGQWMQAGSPVPVPTNDAYKQNSPSFLSPSSSAWERFVAWLRYHSIQTRWDIERRLARKFHRRWGN
jgi:hypothetical protein